MNHQLPQIILLNGTGSSGKTSIAKQLQEDLPYQFLNFSIDSVLYALPQTDLKNMCKGEPIVRKGYDYDQLIEGYHACLPSLLKTGCHLIIDNAWINTQQVMQLFKKIKGYRCCLIAVNCELVVAKERERNRGDRAIGLAEYEFPLVHEAMHYDFQVDASQQSPQQLSQRIIDYLAQNHSFNALSKTLQHTKG